MSYMSDLDIQRRNEEGPALLLTTAECTSTITWTEARGYLGADCANVFPNESQKAHDAAVRHALRELEETGSVSSWSLRPDGTDAFTITTT